jgi:hypothetical protein
MLTGDIHEFGKAITAPIDGIKPSSFISSLMVRVLPTMKLQTIERPFYQDVNFLCTIALGSRNSDAVNQRRQVYGTPQTGDVVSCASGVGCYNVPPGRADDGHRH